MLFHLEVGNAVAQQAADPVVLFKHGWVMAHPRQLLGAGQTRRARADHGDALAGAALGQLRLDPAFAPSPVNDLALDGLDSDRRVLNVQGAGRFARGRADPSRKFWEVVGGVQGLQRLGPVLPIDQIVPVGDQVIDRATGVTERNAAIHTARSLLTDFGRGQRLYELLPRLQTVLRRLVGTVAAADL